MHQSNNHAPEEVLYLAHELCEGGNLGRAMEESFFVVGGTRDPHMQHILQVAWEVCVGLQYIHSKQAVHGTTLSLLL
jgi:serine/threonine protein kinase